MKTALWPIPTGRVFLVADGMGGQDCGEQASGMAADIIPRVLHDRLAARDDASHAVQQRLGRSQPSDHQRRRGQNAGRRMGTTAVLAVRQDDHFYVASVGDSRAYWVRGDSVEQLTVDHTVAEALARNGTLTPDQAKQSPWRNVLYKFLGCVEMTEGADVRPLTPDGRRPPGDGERRPDEFSYRRRPA